MPLTTRDLVLLGLTATVGAIIGTIAVGVVLIELTKSTSRHPLVAGVRNYLVAGVNGVDNQSATL